MGPASALVLCGDPGVPVHGPSGASAHLRGVARGLAALGARVGLAALGDADARGRHDVPLGLPAITGRRPWPRGLRALGERLDARAVGERALRTWGPPDLVWERFSLHADAGARLARRCGALHLVELNAPLSLQRRRVGVEARVLAQADRVLAVSPWLVDYARARGARAVWVPNGSDLVPGDREPTRERLGLEGLVLVHHGSLRPWHGAGFLVEVLDRLPEATLLLIGDGPGLGPHPRVRHLPAADPPALGALLSAADLGLLPYPPAAPPWFDPLKLRDYQAIGLPVLGSAHPACAEADLRLPRDPAAWAQGIRRLAGLRHPPRARTWRAVCAEALAGLLPSEPAA